MDRMSGGGERTPPTSGLDLFEESFKESLGSVDERQELYKDLANQMLNGVPLDQQEILILTYGMKWDDEKARPMELDTLIPQLTRQELMAPGSTQVENIASGIERESMFEMKEQVFPFLPGGAAKTVATKGPGLIARGGAYLASHPWRTAGTIGGAAGILGFSLNPGGGEAIYGTQADATSEPETVELTEDEVQDLTEEEFNALVSSVDRRDVMVIDATTGKPIILTQEDRDRLSNQVSTGTDAATTGGGGTFSPGLIEKANALGISPEELAQLQVVQDDGFGTINPWMFGEIKVPFNTFPYGVDVTSGEAYREPQSRDDPIPPALAALLPEDDYLSAQPPTVVPPGGQINPKSFDKYKDWTLLELVAETAEIYDLPVEVLYGLINAESGFATNAMSPDGTRVGLAQIDLELYPHVSVEQAQNPMFAIRWAGRELKMNTNKFGSLEGAVVSQFDMAEAQFLADNGQFSSPYAKSFVSDVYTYAGSSGMGKYMLDPSSLPSVRTIRTGGGGGGGGIKLPAYQAPDQALLSQIVRATYENELGRKPIGDESGEDVGRLNSWYKDKYNADIAKIQGKTSTAVDPQAQYEEYIRGLGEFDYREESRGTRDVMSFMGEIVRIMQGV